MTILRIEQGPPHDGKYLITLRHLVDGVQKRTAAASIEFALTDQEQEELRWYLEDFLQKAAVTAPVVVEQITGMIRERGEELYRKVFTANANTQALWFAVRDQLADLRVEVTTGIAEAASIPWELMCDPEQDSAISLQVKAFVRVQSDSSIAFLDVPPLDEYGRLRLLYIVCRPSGSRDVPLRALANRILQDLGEDRDRFDITALRPPTFEQLQKELGTAKAEGRPYHIVHFDGHGVFGDLSATFLTDWLDSLSSVVLGGEKKGKHGYLLFEHPGSGEKMRPVDGAALGQLLHDHGSPVLVLNACQSAMHEAKAAPSAEASVHDEIRAIGSLSQAVIDQGVPAVLGMRYSVYVVTAAQYIGELYRGLAQGQSFGEAASTGRKHLHLNPDRWLGLRPQTLQDWCVPVVHEAMPISLLPPSQGGLKLGVDDDRDPVLSSALLRRHVPESGFVGRDETLLALDRAFDTHRIVLLYAYAGQGKSSTAVEFARWYALTGGLGQQPIVLFSSFEQHLDLASLLNQLAAPFLPMLEANGIHWHALNQPEKRRALVLQLLRQIPVLWIWDNVELVAGFPAGTPSQWSAAEQEELRDFLAGIAIDTRSQVKLLLTSRGDERLWLGTLPLRISMPRMSDGDAAKLAQQLGAERKITRSEVGDWQPLLDYCAGNPLTLRVLVGQAIRMGMRGQQHLRSFTEKIRSGEQSLHDMDVSEGRDHSLGASLDYGFKHAFKDDELPIIALLHLFQGTVDVDVLELIGKSEHALQEVQGRSKEQLISLLHRAGDVGLLTHLKETWFTIHPALPWFLRQFFVHHYNGQSGRSPALAAQRAWVEAVGELGNYYHRQFNEGLRGVIELLELEEANFLAARRLARLQRWWRPVLSVMQGLRTLYEYQGRNTEWARIVAEIVPDYCSPENEPFSSSEDAYRLVMEYRVSLAMQVDRDLIQAVALQEKVVSFDRQQAREALSLKAEEVLADRQRHQVRRLAASIYTLGQLRRNSGDASCVVLLQEASRLCARISDRSAQAAAEFNLGNAYLMLPVVRDLNAAESAYYHSLDLHSPQDTLGRSKCIEQIAMVKHERFIEAQTAKEPDAILQQYSNAALQLYRQALALCPTSALTDLGPMHHQLGTLLSQVGKWDDARSHFEQAIQCFEASGNRHSAGQTRANVAILYLRASEDFHESSSRCRDFLHRAQAYAQAAKRDYQHYQGRAASEEAKVEELLHAIAEKHVLSQVQPESHAQQAGLSGAIVSETSIQTLLEAISEKLQSNASRYIREIKLTNIRTFRPGSVLNLCLEDGKPAQWTVILGENGTGKSTLLQYIAGMHPVRSSERELGSKTIMPGLRPYILAPQFEAWHTANLSKWMTLAKPNGSIGEVGMSCDVQLSDETTSFDACDPEIVFSWQLRLRMDDGKWSNYGSTGTFDSSLLTTFAPIAYGATRHLADAKYIASGRREEVEVESMFDETIAITSPDEWLLRRHHAVLESKDAGAKESLERAIQCLCKVLPDVSNIRIGLSEGTDSRVSVFFKTDYGEVPFDSLSLGYRTTAGWIIDYIRRMHVRFPDIKEPEKAPAIVLIDEFDLHMHVSWQMNIMEHLSKVFPNTQFIITAHSPLVVQAVEGRSKVVVLRREKRDDGVEEVVIDNSPDIVQGWRLDQLVTSDLYGLKSSRKKAIAQKFERWRELLQKEQLRNEESTELNQLNAYLDEEAPPTDDEVIDESMLASSDIETIKVDLTQHLAGVLRRRAQEDDLDAAQLAGELLAEGLERAALTRRHKINDKRLS